MGPPRERHVWDDMAGVRASRSWPLDQVLHVLSSGDMTAIELIPWGSNYTFAVRLQCDGCATLAVYKPLRGEAPLWDFPPGLYRREYASYVVAGLLGWDFIPPTIVRDGQHGIGSVQLFVEHDGGADYFSFRSTCADELKRMCAFDVIVNNADRKAGHCLKGADGRLWGIDHGLTFNVQPKLRTVIWDYGGEAIPQSLVDDLLDFRTDGARLRELYAAVGDCLAKDELAMFLKRIDRLIEEPVYPAPYSRRSHPWPLY